jgi:hypothetical protein
VVALAGCGGKTEAQQAEQAGHDFLKRSGQGDGRTACAAMGPDVKRALLESSDTASCDEIIKEIGDPTGAESARRSPTPRLGSPSTTRRQQSPTTH